MPPIQKLMTVKPEHAYYRDAGRRSNAIRLAHAEGLLVCPTHAGQVFGVEVANHGVRWTYTYKEEAPPACPHRKAAGPSSGAGTAFPEKTLDLEIPRPVYSRWQAGFHRRGRR